MAEEEGDGMSKVQPSEAMPDNLCPKCHKKLEGEEVIGNLFAGLFKTIFTLGAGYERLLPTRKQCPKCKKWYKVVSPAMPPKEDWVHNYFFSNIFPRGTKKK